MNPLPINLRQDWTDYQQDVEENRYLMNEYLESCGSVLDDETEQEEHEGEE